jgi:hypothetical protein
MGSSGGAPRTHREESRILPARGTAQGSPLSGTNRQECLTSGVIRGYPRASALSRLLGALANPLLSRTFCRQKRRALAWIAPRRSPVRVRLAPSPRKPALRARFLCPGSSLALQLRSPRAGAIPKTPVSGPPSPTSRWGSSSNQADTRPLRWRRCERGSCLTPIGGQRLVTGSATLTVATITRSSDQTLRRPFASHAGTTGTTRPPFPSHGAEHSVGPGSCSITASGRWCAGGCDTRRHERSRLGVGAVRPQTAQELATAHRCLRGRRRELARPAPC